ncbi:MAG: oligosaccharide flippase family protein, partial [Candidatus Omnitrophica bacterium]|nr:oligosaccharide flippase family protein [Candidatus Omnitrophota bacterium]
LILTDYGFNLSAPREISINRDDKRKLSEIFSSIMITKLFLFAISLLIMSAIIFFFDRFRRDWVLYYLTFGMVLGQTMFPTWFFQGVENMKFITILNLLAKLIFTISIFIFVRKQTDYYFVPLLNSLGFIISGITAMWIIFFNFKIRFFIPDRKYVFNWFKNSLYIFISTLVAGIYVNLIPFITGVLTNVSTVGYYVAGEKIIRSIESLYFPLNSSLYPYIKREFHNSLDKGLKFLKKILLLVSIISLILVLVILSTSHLFVPFVLGKEFTKSIPVVRILSFLLLAKGIGHIFLIQTMLNIGADKYVFFIVVVSAILCIFSSIIFIPKFLYIGSAISAVIPEIFMMISSGFFVMKKFDILRKVKI